MKKIPWWYTRFDELERQALLEAFDAGQFTLGQQTRTLEDEIARAFDVPYAIVTNSGTSALLMALIALDVKPGDEVIVPNITWIATAQAAAILGARVVLADTLPDLPLLDVDEVIKKITPKTKVILPVHLNGRRTDIDRLVEICERSNIHLVEDTCKGMFSRHGNRFLGTFGDVGCFSMGMISPVPCAYGGFLITRNQALFEKLKIIRWHGTSYENGESYKYLGYNFKFSDLLGAVALSRFRRREETLHSLRLVYERYLEGLREVQCVRMIPVDLEQGEIPLLIDVRSNRREQIKSYLKASGVETCDFHEPLHKAAYLNNQGSFVNSNSLASESFHLPSGPSQSFETIDLVLDLLRKFDSNHI